MVAGTVNTPHKMSALSGHFTASSLSEETETKIGMNSLDPVMYPVERPTSKTSNLMVQNRDAIDNSFQRLFACMSIAYNKR